MEFQFSVYLFFLYIIFLNRKAEEGGGASKMKYF